MTVRRYFFTAAKIAQVAQLMLFKWPGNKGSLGNNKEIRPRLRVSEHGTSIEGMDPNFACETLFFLHIILSAKFKMQLS